MSFTFQQSLTLKGQNGEEAILSSPYVNDDKELEFKYCSFFMDKVKINEKKQAIEIQSKGKTIYLLLRNENESVFQQCMEIRKQILTDIRTLMINFQSGKEPIYAIESGNKLYPYLITTPSVLKNGQYSIKYQKAVQYFIGEEAKKKGKEVQTKEYEALLETVSKALHKSDISKMKSGMFGTDKYYEISLDNLVELL